MIYTCTLNPAIDLFVDSDSLDPYVVNRTNTEDYQANGKTINISLILKKMGINNTALGFIGGFTGKFIESELQQQGIITDFIEINGITRVNTFVRTKEKEYKIVNKGPEVPLSKKEEMLTKIRFIPEGSILFVSGSLPKGLSDDIYLEISEISKQNNFKLILDISSKTLLDCLPNRPYLIKPNREELANWFDKDDVTLEEVLTFGYELLHKGAMQVLISLGEEGSIYMSHEIAIHVTSPQGKVVNTACSGDALLGSFIAKLEQDSDLEEALIYASATGASTAFSMGLSDLTDIDHLVKSIKLNYINTFNIKGV
ncbi:1-phosphofructokinase [Bacillus pakistanensis]|uniref:Tagatose-6-phosphate kinase n=1 Tax=Rossellomorea pakistanensis TaxID=992288 RepID=A0ABS2NHG6_9BACI|nr:1-phosphofructokinase [Bacillus pakistanensis]MBM7587245.1 1-phosphofructokinase [Bacillus pakistanensis]